MFGAPPPKYSLLQKIDTLVTQLFPDYIKQEHCCAVKA
jgi:hypothetical protein